MTGVRGHDPLCPIARETWCIWTGDKCARCALITRIREDERERSAEIAEHHAELEFESLKATP